MKKLNSNLIHVVNLLKDHQYHDGTSIGKKLHTTRSAIWKLIKKLQQYDVQIDSVKGKGYALQEQLILLEQNKIQQRLINENVEMIIFESIHSTNEYIFASLRNKRGNSNKKNKFITICLAEQQTSGKGRLNRDWYSPFGKNIYLSCLYPFQKDISELAGLSLVTSLAIVRTLNSYGKDNHFSAKWPNDVVYEREKISGNLIAIQAESHGISHAIIGIGVNVNMLKDNHHITQAWTSLQKILGEYIDRNELCVRLINNLLSYLDEFASNGFAAFKDEWMKADCLMSREITLQHVNNKILGKAVGVNEQGHLLLQLADGSIQAFSSGETSVEK